jgi:hypothetical protein
MPLRGSRKWVWEMAIPRYPSNSVSGGIAGQPYLRGGGVFPSHNLQNVLCREYQFNTCLYENDGAFRIAKERSRNEVHPKRSIRTPSLASRQTLLDFTFAFSLCSIWPYSGRKITESLGNVTVRGEKRWKEQGGSAMANSLSEHV